MRVSRVLCIRFCVDSPIGVVLKLVMARDKRGEIEHDGVLE